MGHPSPQVICEFKLPDQQMTSLSFTSRPLGMKFFKRRPVTVKKICVNFPADNLGIQSNWILRSINGASLESLSHATFDDDFAYFQEAIERLPLTAAVPKHCR